MKFRLVDPEDGFDKRGSAAVEDVEDDGAEGADDPGNGADETADAAERAEAEKTPEGRLKASTQRLAAEVKQDAAGISDVLADFAQQIADRESPVAGTGHRPAPAPSSFRAERFTPDGPGSAEHSESAPPSVSGRPGSGRTPAAGSTMEAMEPDTPRGRPSIDDRR